MPPTIVADEDETTLSNDYAIYRISKNGRSESLRLNATTPDLTSGPGPFASYLRGGPPHHSSSVSYTADPPGSPSQGFLKVSFPNDVVVRIFCKAEPTHFVFEVVDVSAASAVDMFDMVELQLAGEANRLGSVFLENGVVVSQLVLNLHTNTIVRSPPRISPKYLLSARSYSQLGLGSKVALLVCTREEWPRLVREIEQLHGLPHPEIEELWAKEHPDVRTSYLFVDLTKHNVENVIEYAKRGRFRYVMPYAGTWAQSWGHYEPHPDNYPDGLADLRSVAGQLHDHGMKLGLHTLAVMINKGDLYVRPVPDRRLARESPLTLAGNIPAEDGADFIPIAESETDSLARYHGYLDRGEPDVVIDDEIFTLDRVDIANNRLVVKRRGAHGTCPALHPGGSTVWHLPEFFGSYLPSLDPDGRSELLDEIAGNLAKIFRGLGTSTNYFVFLDGSGGLTRLLPEGFGWFGGHLVVDTFYRHLDVPNGLLVERSGGPLPYDWHVLTRGVSGDFAAIGVEAYMDHVKIDHFRNNLYRKAFPGASEHSDHFPQELGWIGFLAKVGRRWGEDSFPSTTVDQIEYQLNRSLGHGVPIGLWTYVEDLQANGLTEDVLDRIGDYEHLRLSNYFPARVLEELRQPDEALLEDHGLTKMDHELVKNARGVFGFRRRAYVEWVAEAGGDPVVVDNPFASQFVQAKVVALPAHADPESGREDDAIELLQSVAHLKVVDGADFIQEVLIDADGRRITVKYNDTAPADSRGWVALRKTFSTLDLRDHKVIAVKLAGDNPHAVVSVQLRASVQDRQYQFPLRPQAGPVPADQVRRVLLHAPATGELFKYPYYRTPLDVKQSLRPFRYDRINELTVYLKNLAPGPDPLQLSLHSIRALRQGHPPLVNPSLTIESGRGGIREVSLPVSLSPRGWVDPQTGEQVPEADEHVIVEPWDHVVLSGREYTVRTYNNVATQVGRVPPVRLAAGPNTITYRHESGGKALVTIVMVDKPRFHTEHPRRNP